MADNITVDMGRTLVDLARRYPEIVREESRAVLRVIEQRVESRVVALTPRGVGGQAGLAGSIHGEVVETGGKTLAEIGTPLEYGEVVELGRRPGQRQPPVDPIALWAMRKLGVSAEEAHSVGFVIARKIGREGFPGAHMFQQTIDELDGWIMGQLKLIPRRVQRRIEG